MTDYYRHKHRVRDSQISKVYTWGNVIKKDLPKINKFQIEKLIESSCEILDLYPPHLELTNKRKVVACYKPGKHTICLPNADGSWAHNMEVVLHETSHAVHHEFMRRHRNQDWVRYEESHGAGFMAINVFLLTQFTELSKNELLYQAWKLHIRVGDIFKFTGGEE